MLLGTCSRSDAPSMGRNLALWSLDASADFDLETFEDAEWLMPSEDGDILANVVHDGLLALKATEDSREEDLLVLLKFIRHSHLFSQLFFGSDPRI